MNSVRRGMTTCSCKMGKKTYLHIIVQATRRERVTTKLCQLTTHAELPFFFADASLADGFGGGLPAFSAFIASIPVSGDEPFAASIATASATRLCITSRLFAFFTFSFSRASLQIEKKVGLGER